jgi:hypothetical protein
MAINELQERTEMNVTKTTYSATAFVIDIPFCGCSLLRELLPEPQIPRGSVERETLDLLSDLQPLR